MTAAKMSPATSFRPLSSLVAVLSLLGVAQPAMAEDRDPAAAEVLFREGKELMTNGHFEQACPKLAESYRLDPATGALLATALCYERAGRTASAWAAYTDAAARAKSDGAVAREQSARAKAAELEPKLDRLVVSVAGAAPSGLVVTRDGTVLGEAEWGTPIPVDPGSHVVAANAAGKVGFRAVVSVRGAVTQRVSIPELADLPPPDSASAPPAETAAPAAPSPSVAPGFWTPLRVTGTITTAVGVAAVAVGAVFGARALSRNADSNKNGHCKENDDCDAVGTRLRNEARNAGDVATLAMVSGLALAAGGVALFAVGAPADPALELWVTPPVVGRGELVFRALF